LTAWHLREHPDHALRSDALLNELYGELFAGEHVSWQNRAHFFEVASGQLRRVLIDHARARAVGKRDGGRLRLSLTEANGLASPREEDLVDLHEALNRLDGLDPRPARIVELRFFGGLTEKESAEVMGISMASLRRDWDFAQAWLTSQSAV